MQGVKIIRPPKQRLADLVYYQILEAMQSGDIKPDERLHQERLADNLQVSRTPVREALLRLENDGLLNTSGNGGFEIFKATPADVRDIYQAREAIEGYCAGFLAEHAATEVLQNIRNVIVREENGLHVTAREYYNANQRIHRSFVKAAGNAYLLTMFDGIWNRSISMIVFNTMTEESLKVSNTGHIALLEVIETGDPVAARGAMRAHINAGLNLQLQTV
ncbi:MAG: GntR family transcriptional regulator [Pikeienuella sp.]